MRVVTFTSSVRSVHEVHQNRLRVPSGTNYESHLEHMEQPFVQYYSIAFERFELGLNIIKYHVQVSFLDIEFDTIRTQFETQTFTMFTRFTSSGRSVYELCHERSTFTNFNVHEFQRSRISISIWGIVKTNRLLLHCIRTFRAGFESYSTYSNMIQRDISFDTVFDTTRTRFEPSSNPVRIPLEPGSKHKLKSYPNEYNYHIT